MHAYTYIIYMHTTNYVQSINTYMHTNDIIHIIHAIHTIHTHRPDFRALVMKVLDKLVQHAIQCAGKDIAFQFALHIFTDLVESADGSLQEIESIDAMDVKFLNMHEYFDVILYTKCIRNASYL